MIPDINPKVERLLRAEAGPDRGEFWCNASALAPWLTAFVSKQALAGTRRASASRVSRPSFL